MKNENVVKFGICVKKEGSLVYDGEGEYLNLERLERLFRDDEI